MIVKEYYSTRKDGVRLNKSYSDKGLKIRKIGTNEIYDTAIDIETAPYVYEETSIPVKNYEDTNSDN